MSITNYSIATKPVALLLATAALFAGLACDERNPGAQEYLQVTASEPLVLRAGPSATTAAVEELAPDRLLTAEGEASKETATGLVWLPVETLQGKAGFVVQAGVETVRESARAFFEVPNEHAPVQACGDDDGCRAELEARAIAASGNRVRRAAGALIIRTGKGELRLTDHEQGIDANTYHALLVFADDWLLVEARHLDGEDYLLVHLPTGRRLRLWDLPVPGDEGQRLVVAAAAVAGRPNGVQIVRLSAAGPLLEFERELDWFPAEPRWDGADVEIARYRNVFPPDQIDGEMTRNIARLKLTESGWEFVGSDGAAAP